MSTKAFSFDSYILKGMTYPVYVDLLKDLLTEGKTTGVNQDPHLFEYAKLNIQRMERIFKTVVVNEELANAVKAISEKQTWLCITEGWCGDAAQSVALFERLAELNDNITFKLVLRDENIELIDQYLTNGGRAIPMVIALQNGKEVWKWGPRPASLQKVVDTFKENPTVTLEDLKTQLHTWYAKNKTIDQQNELLERMK
ncbi:MAG: thioredoxin family protein [Bacteroidia bacterium]|nr:thioredoxin family protein [Bacteroidia bacterium]MBP9689418.1 thioredoxin family protein [Bacteroidia bacterium]